uniref:Putative ovule protein n=1 Tax=Solanum chacoense TaxID=4108 RepID=A0A0V0H1I8_SOLCH
MDVYSWFRRSLSRTTKTATTTTTVTAQPDDELLYGVTDQLLDFVKSISIDTFRNFSLPDEDDGDAPENVPKDLSDWQQRHALLVLSKLKELSQLRFKLCPRFLKDHQFWMIYFALVKGFVAKYELRAIQFDKLKQMRLESENTPDVAACEVEMSEAKKTTDLSPTISEEHN